MTSSTSLKSQSPNTVTFWGPGCWDFNRGMWRPQFSPEQSPLVTWEIPVSGHADRRLTMAAVPVLTGTDFGNYRSMTLILRKIMTCVIRHWPWEHLEKRISDHLESTCIHRNYAKSQISLVTIFSNEILKLIEVCWAPTRGQALCWRKHSPSFMEFTFP